MGGVVGRGVRVAKDLGEIPELVRHLSEIAEAQLAIAEHQRRWLALEQRSIDNEVLWSGSVSLANQPWWNQDFRAPFAHLFIKNPTPTQIDWATSDSTHSPNPVGPGRGVVPAFGWVSIPVSGRSLSVYTDNGLVLPGASPPPIGVTVLSRPEAPDAGEVGSPLLYAQGPFASFPAGSAPSGSSQGAAFDLGCIRMGFNLVTVTTAGITAGSVRLNGSLDGVNWFNTGATTIALNADACQSSAIGTVPARYLAAYATVAVAGGTVEAQVCCGDYQ